MFLHAAELIYVHWSSEIEDEWVRNVVENHDADRAGIEACLRGMRDAVPGYQVAGYAKYVKLFEPVDAKDRHVAAAAYKLSLDEWPGREVALVTKNVTDFPAQAFAQTEVTRFNMASYVDALYAEEPERVLQVVKECRAKLKSPKYTAGKYVEALVKHGCMQLAQAAAHVWRVECPTLTKSGEIQYEADRVDAEKAAKKQEAKRAKEKKAKAAAKRKR